MFSYFSYELQKILNISKIESKELGHSYVGTEHFVLAILKGKNYIKDILNENNISYENYKEKIISKFGTFKNKNKLFVLTPLFKKILEESTIISNESNNKEIDIDLVFKTILDEAEGAAYRLLCEYNIDINNIYESIDINTTNKNHQLLSELAICLTDNAKNNLIDPVIGREKELNNIINVILRKNKKNPLLIGEAGVGKTAIVESLAIKIINNEVPRKLMNKKIYSISMANIVAGTKYRGEFEEKLLKLIKELESIKNGILFIDEIHTIVEAGGAEGAIDASNILKPALARGNLTIIGATTIEEYRKHIEKDKALARRFQPVLIEEPNKKDLYNILIKSKESYEKYHGVLFNNKNILHIINVSSKFFPNRKEPDRSLDILDEVSSYITSSDYNYQKKYLKTRRKLLNYNNKISVLLKNNDYENAIKYRERSRKIESIINKKILLNKNEIKTIKNKDIDEMISKKLNIKIGNNNIINNYLKNIKKELIKNNKEYSNQISSFLKNIKKIFLSNSNNKPVVFSMNGFDKESEKIINNIENFLFNNKIVIDLDNITDMTDFISLKEKTISIIILNNYNRANFKVKKMINNMLENGFFKDEFENTIYINNSLIILTNLYNTKTIGFENKNKCVNDLLPKVDKEIDFSKDYEIIK